MQKYFLELKLKKVLPKIPQFEEFLKQYQEWNHKINLSAIKEEKEIIIKHFYDSLLLEKLKPFQKNNLKIADLGTGGGFPLLPLAIMNPECEFLGIDSVGKKLKVIDEIAKELGLNNVETLHGRIEEIGQDEKYRGVFDIVTTRAFAKWHTLLELALPLIKKGGRLFAYQGPQIADELKKSEKIIEMLGGKLEGLSFFTLPEEMGERVIVEIKKIKHSPKQYPREMGIPKKKPLQ